MPALKTYHLFISHAWKYDDDYKRLVDLLKEAKYFEWKNFSVPKNNPVLDPSKPASKKKLTEELDQQIKPVHCVLVISGMYVNYKEWLQTEIDIAQKYNKPIVGVKPWGQQRIPSEVQSAANIMVGWNTSSIVDAIRTYAK